MLSCSISLIINKTINCFSLHQPGYTMTHNDVRFVFIHSCLQEGPYLIYVSFCSVRLYPQLFVGGSISDLRQFAYRVVKNVCVNSGCLIAGRSCLLFTWVQPSGFWWSLCWSSFQFSVVCLVYSMLRLSLDCPFLIATSVFF